MVMKRIMRSLKGTLDIKLCLNGKDIALKGFTLRIGQEMQTTNDPPRGTCLLLVLELFYANARKPTIALSMTEAKCMATSHCTKKML